MMAKEKEEIYEDDEEDNQHEIIEIHQEATYHFTSWIDVKTLQQNSKRALGVYTDWFSRSSGVSSNKTMGTVGSQGTKGTNAFGMDREMWLEIDYAALEEYLREMLLDKKDEAAFLLDNNGDIIYLNVKHEIFYINDSTHMD
jgi:hypothetical protein